MRVRTGSTSFLLLFALIWGCVLVPSIVVYYWRRFVVGSGAKDLVIDDETRILALPQTFGRKVDVMVPVYAIKKIDIKTVTHHNKNGTSYTYRPRINWNDEGEDHESELADWMEKTRAQSFVDWLEKRLEPLRS